MSDVNDEAPVNPAVGNLVDITKGPDRMSKAELQGEVEHWRNMYSYLPDGLKSFMAQIGQAEIIFKRDGAYFKGSYSGFEISITHHRFTTYERIRDQIEKKYFIHKNEVIVPTSNIVDFKFVKETYEDTEDPYYQPPPVEPADPDAENGSNDSRQD